MSTTLTDAPDLVGVERPDAVIFPPFSSPARSALQEKLQTVRTRRNDLQAIIDQCDAEISHIKHCLSPIGHIPPEILSQIFLYCCPEDFAYQLTHHGSPQTKFNVLDVCHKWRDIASKSPSIWNRLDFHFPRRMRHNDDTECECLGKYVENLESWLSRATRDLSVSWHHPESDLDRVETGRHGQLPEILMQQLVSTAGAWRCLDFNGTERERAILWNSRVSMDSLVDLNFACHSLYPKDLESKHFPRLQNLRIGPFIKLFNAPSLLRLSMSISFWHEWPYIATAFPLLEDLVVNNNNLVVFDFQPQTLSNLKTLEFIGTAGSYINSRCCIGPLRTPQLKLLRFQVFSSIDMGGFFGSSVTSLELSYMNSSGPMLDARTILNALPLLSTIRVAHDPHSVASGVIIEVLIDPSVSPNLSHIALVQTLINIDTLLSFSSIRSPRYLLVQEKVQCLVTLDRCTRQNIPKQLPNVNDADYSNLSEALCELTNSLPAQHLSLPPN